MTLRELIASIAHEVNQPLTAIVANAECCLDWLAAEQPDMARVRQAAERIVRNGHHASAVLGGICDLLKNPSPAMSVLDLNEVILDILELMNSEFRRHDVVVQIELCRHIGRIRGNRTQLQQVILNLIKNGIESMSDCVVRPLLLRVSTSMSHGSAVVAIEDSGIGFDSATAERMFEPFYTTKHEGTGVGLSICRSIVDDHGGVLWAAHKEPAGSVFRFTVPTITRHVSMES
jgi:C4-dicarboxylate-specific signal transduction histidine kinase